ncbi:hypothetical protein MMC12_006139 [Toensbergia leucococca]|nr:hypothetical protein [Toensbergia leucococca]
MNANLLLRSQGWRGSGHSLHPSTDTSGLSSPLLVSQKRNNNGVGKIQHKTSDMWWLNAFDKTLKGLDTSEEGKVVQTVTNGGLDMVKSDAGRFRGLYAGFVRGQGLAGTIAGENSEEGKREGKGGRDRQRKETREERKARRLARRTKRERAESGIGATATALKPLNQDAHDEIHTIADSLQALTKTATGPKKKTKKSRKDPSKQHIEKTMTT